MEDLAATLMSSFSHRHSAPLYLFYNVASLPKHHAGRGGGGGGGGGFEFATAAGGKQQGGVDDGEDGGAAGVRACSSDLSAATFADELFREGVLLRPLKLPPRLQTPTASAAASAATSPTAASKAAAAAAPSSSRSPFASRRSKHEGFDPFAAALEKVRRDVAAAPIRRARSLSPLRGPAVAAAAARRKENNPYAAAAPARAVTASRPPWRRRRRGMKRLLCGAAMATRPHRGDDGGAPYRRGLLVCFGF
uniref:Uncharacterized protein n=1 Tax=Oryza meridionalis TaxID=40149 RepID=A0A0E0C0W1_9ORYZ